MASRSEYFLWAFKQSLRLERNTCPACESVRHRIVRRKFAVTALRECRNCFLRFRTPKDEPSKVERFYVDEEYKQGFTTDLPSDAELQHMLANGFAGTEKAFDFRIEAMRAAGLDRGARVLDFGSSWGYGSWQMRQAGFEVLSYEIGRDRARYAKEKLGCTVVTDLRTLDGTVDCFFSSHVIEHLPSPNILFDEAQKLLRPGGILITYCPNGAPERERKHFDDYHRNWGMVHPLMLTPAFLKGEARRRGFTHCAAYSSPVNIGDIKAQCDGSCDGDELLLVARKQ
jgi:2-polyprenyl-3-methyl-5-hydroxy-6-metoxy-1,4-benzoquinol methylase